MLDAAAFIEVLLRWLLSYQLQSANTLKSR
jgi:hypothetical protein